ncbi:purine-binding chemotaxis protein CheW, partial [Bacillaceae bacterium Marseille-Q3522]|nr:purine-binding chemotaxis protein CheW [Bacillaceae bacterium Marseille-Q3522]
MAEAVAGEIKLIVFQLQAKEYAIPVEYVRGIEKVGHITRIPGVSPYMKGVINLRGVITPIIDLRIRFGLEEKKHSETTRIIIISLNEHEIGLIADTADDVIDISPEQIEPAPDVVGIEKTVFIKG